MSQIKLSHPFVTAVGTLVFAAVAFVSGVGAVTMLRTAHVAQNVAAVALAPEVFPKPLALDENALLAHAAVVYDPSDGKILFAKNASRSLPLASLTKLMAATVVLDRTTDPGTVVTLDESDLLPDGSWGFRVGDRVTIADLLSLGLIASSNDAIQAAARSVGNYIVLMNNTARTRGFDSMHFYNATGLDESSTTAGAYGSAYDVARLASDFFAAYPQYFTVTTHTSHVSIHVGGRTLDAKATAVPLEELPGVIAAKTGYTDLAGGNLVVVFDVSVGHPLVAVVLGSTEEGRFTDMQRIIAAARLSQ
jgi:D-alanyl-D-alanine carboxypeptidase (penicillin-binding protein 5/6)